MFVRCIGVISIAFFLCMSCLFFRLVYVATEKLLFQFLRATATDFYVFRLLLLLFLIMRSVDRESDIGSSVVHIWEL